MRTGERAIGKARTTSMADTIRMDPFILRSTRGQQDMSVVRPLEIIRIPVYNRMHEYQA